MGRAIAPTLLESAIAHAIDDCFSYRSSSNSMGFGDKNRPLIVIRVSVTNQ
jgi:hypothetical protein